jgi:hypothetical protein
MHSNYHAFTEQLAATLATDSRVLGLVALGSMGGDPRAIAAIRSQI